jgi:hypothetical protein
LRDARRRRRQLPLVRPQVEGEEGGKQRKAARVDDREAAGNECDRDRDGVDRDLLLPCSTFRRLGALPRRKH